MHIAITARHCTISEPLRRRAAERLTSLSRFEPRLESAKLRFDTARHVCSAEVEVHVGGHRLVASGSDTNFRNALEMATDRVERRLKRRRERMVARKVRRPATALL